MSLRDLTARSSQAKSIASDDDLEAGRRIYRKIVDEHDLEELRKFKSLADASARMERPVEVKRPKAPRFGALKRATAAVLSVFGR
jgi:hypothetical protein